MPEATMILLDNSDFSINGDYQPTRWLAQIDAASLLIQTKLEQHHQNAMGIGLTAGKQVQIICTLTNDLTKASSFLYGIKQHGQQKIGLALQTAALALKHKSNPNLSQRIVCFIASTINDNLDQLRIICRKLKKSNIGLDLIALGDLSEAQRQKLQAMHELSKSDTNSELIFVEPDANVSDMLFSSKLLGAEPPQIKEDEDPELLMALQLSLQEEEQRLSQVRERMVGEDEELEQQALRLAMEGAQKEQDKKDDSKKE